MNVFTVSVVNFASYKTLSFTVRDRGLLLIHGANGSGKSTLCDVIPWILFGRTAKDGAVDEVLSWGSSDPTIGSLCTVEGLVVYRSRGAKPKDNDLYFMLSDGPVQRGKDIPDTQKLINQHLGIDLDLYLSGAYFHEFSKIAQFFTAKAKDRRALCEQIVDLSLPKRIQTALKDDKKTLQAHLALTSQSRTRISDRLDHLEQTKEQATQLLQNFEKDKKETLAGLLNKLEHFERRREQTLKDLETKRVTFTEDLSALGVHHNTPCPTCGTKPNATVVATLSEKLKQVQKELTRWESQENPYVEPMETEEARQNTHQEQLDDINHNIKLRKGQLVSADREILEVTAELADTELLAEVTEALRAELVKDTIQRLQDHTNSLLSEHFEGELSIMFDVSNADTVEVSVFKDGNQCSYTQLSKGQRQMLKLSFAVAVMKRVADQHGVKFEQLFFDEALDGFSDTTKDKAYGLLEKLSLDCNSVFVVEHSNALKNNFNNQIEVTLVSGFSTLDIKE